MVTQVGEKVVVDTAVKKFPFRDVKQVLSSNDQLKALFGCVLFFNLAVHLIGSFAIYYFTYAIGKEELFGAFMFAAGAAEITGIFLFPYLSKILPRKLMWFLASCLPVICCVVLSLAGLTAPENIWLVGIAGACMKFGFGIVNGLATVMLADVVDYG